MTTPAIYEHCETIYNAMLEVATPTKLPDVEEDVMVYEGFLTKLFTKNRLSVPYYTAVTRELQKMDCIRQLRRGGGSAPSQWLMVQAPTEELFGAATRRPSPRDKTSNLDVLKQQVKDLHERVSRLENAS